MPYTIILSDETFTQLQAFAKPFIDTPESLVARLIDDEFKRHKTASVGQTTVDRNQPLRLDPDKHESLKHARLLSAKVDGHTLHRPKWNGLLEYLHVLALKRLGSFDALQKISGARIKKGRFEENGFHYIPEADISLQGLDANLAWTHSLGLARHLRLPVEVKFEWREKEGAANPGRVAMLQWTPPSLAVA